MGYPDDAAQAGPPEAGGHAPVPLVAKIDWTPVAGPLPHVTAVGRTISVIAHAGWRAGNGSVFLLLDVDGGHTMYASRPGGAEFAWSYPACGLRDRALLLAPGVIGRVGNFRLTRLTGPELADLSPLVITRHSY